MDKMAAKEPIRLRRILVCSATITVMTIIYLCSKDTEKWFIQDKILYLKDKCEFDVRRTLSQRALDRLVTYKTYTDFKDLMSLANITTSIFNIRNNKSDVRIGDVINIDIVLYNGRRKRSTRGGDMLRVWLREHSLKASVSGYVIDHDNGSYTGVVKAMWAGNPDLMFSIGNTKEHVGIYMNMVHKYGLITFLRAGFKKHNVTESSLCSVVPNIPNVTAYYNFTAQNYNFSFFCGEPKTLGCDDLDVYFRTSTHSANKKQESLFLNYKYFKKSIGKLTILAGYGATGEPDVPCNDVSSTITWQTTNPTGYLYNGKWRSLICKPSLLQTYDSYAKCLKDRPVLITGDSTTRNWLSPLTKLLKLRIFVKHPGIKGKAFQSFAKAENKNKSLSIVWSPHEIPFYSYEQDKDNFRTVASRIDDLPGNKSAIVLLHWFGHMTRTTPNRFREHVASAKHAILRLLKRSPRSSILLKGPHSFTYRKFLGPIDYMNRIFGQILYEEFKDLQDNVYYIDQWDATVGNENEHIHPDPSLDLEMINFLLSYIC